MTLGLTGATGFVGRHVIQAAVRRGYEVVAFTRDPSRVVHDCVEVRAFRLDATPDLRGCDAIIHLAGENIAGLWTLQKKQRIRDSRILGTRHLVETIVRMDQPPEVLVSASAIGYYGESGDTELTEQAPGGSGFLSKTCVDWEKEALAAQTACRVVNPRIGLVLGPGGGPLKMMAALFRLGLGGPLGSGKQWMSWIHVRDLATLLLFAVENLEMRGAINATSPWPVRNADFTRALAHTLRRPAFLRVPGFFLRAVLGEFSAELLDSKRVLPAVALEQKFLFILPELEPALRDILQ